MVISDCRDNQLKKVKILDDILLKHHNTISCGVKSLKTLGPTIWNQLPGDAKSETSSNKFKEYIDTRFAPKCRCNVCMNI